MKRIINVGKEFCTYVKTPLIADDVRAYCIVWKPGAGSEGAGLLINARRSDGVTVTDFGTVDQNGVGEYVLAGNMYSVTGSLEVRLSVVSETATLTEKVLMFDVISGNGNEGIESEDNVPLLTTVLAKASEAVAKTEKMPEKISQLENDCGFISQVCNENIADGSVTPEKTSFYETMNALSKKVFLKTVPLDTETFIRDKIQDSLIDRIEIEGYSFQNNSIINYPNKMLVTTNITVKCHEDGRMVLNGSLDAGETLRITVPQVTFYESNIYKSKLTLSDDSKRGTFAVFAENFTEGLQETDTTSGAIVIVQGAASGEYNNFELCYTVFEEERSGKNIYPVHCLTDVRIKLSGKNNISYDDVVASSYCSVKREDGGIELDGRYYATLSENFINRLEKGETYTFSCKRNYIVGTGASNVPRIVINYEDGTSNVWSLQKPTAVFDGKKIASASLFFSGTSDVKCQISELMLEEGDTATEYEEYVNETVINVTDVNLHKIGDIADKLVVGEEIYVKRHINSSEIDETKVIDTQYGATTFFGEKTVLGYNESYELYKNKTVKITLNTGTMWNNNIFYYSQG